MEEQILAKFEKEIEVAIEAALAPLFAQAGQNIEKVCELLREIESGACEFHSAHYVIKHMPPPQVRMVPGLSNYVSGILMRACGRKGYFWRRSEDIDDGPMLFPPAIIQEEKLAGLENKIREYVARRLKLGQVLPFARKT